MPKRSFLLTLKKTVFFTLLFTEMFPSARSQEWGYYRSPGKPDKESIINFDGNPYYRYHDPRKPYSFKWCDESKVIRFEVHPGDDQSWVGGGHHAPTNMERAEIFSRTDGEHRNNHANFSKDYWLSFNFLIEPGPVTFQDPIILQFHSTDDRGDVPSNPPLQFRLRKDRLAVMTVADPEKVNKKPTDYPPEIRIPGHIWTIQRFITPKPIIRNTWYNVVVRARFNPIRGRLDTWLDGKKVTSGTIPMGHNDDVGPYLQFGIYRYKSPENLAIRYSAVEHGTNSLLKRVKHPVPTKNLSLSPACT
jgi:hypothetical protein